MAWTRLATLGFEEKYTGEIYTYYPYAISSFSSVAHTGSTSLDVINGRTGAGVADFGIWNQIRVGCFLFVGAPWISNPTLLGVEGLVSLVTPPDNNRIVWVLDESSGQFYLMQESTEIARWSPYVSGNYNVGEWCALSMIAKAGVGGYVSCYVDGNLQMHVSTSYLTDIRSVRLAGGSFYGSTAPYYVDDAYVDGSNSSEPDIVPPSPRFLSLPIHAKGSSNQWSVLGGDTRVKALSLPSRDFNDLPIIGAATANLTELYKINSVAGYDDYDVSAVVVKARALSGDIVNPAGIKFVAHDDVANNLLSPQITLEASPSMKGYRFPLRPDGEAWSKSMADVEFGMLSVGNVVSALPSINPNWVTAFVVTGESYTETEAESQESDFTDTSGGSNMFHSGVRNITEISNTSAIVLRLPPSWASLRAGMWVSATSYDDTSSIFAFMNEANTQLMRIRLDANKHTIYALNQLSSTLYNTRMTSDLPIMRHRDWVHLGMFVNPSVMSFYINGVLMFTYGRIANDTLLATKLGFMKQSNTLGQFSLDDAYLDYSASSETDAPPPLRRFEPFYITNPGSLSEWTTMGTAALRIPFEIGAPDTTTYLRALSSGLRSLFPTGVYQQRPGYQPNGLGLYAYADRNSLPLRTLWELGGTIDFRPFATMRLVDTGWSAYSGYGEIAPDGGAWDKDKIAIAQIGVQSQ